MSRPPQRRDLPPWILLGDRFAEWIVFAILAGGFLTKGYADIAALEGIAQFGCALLGCWALAGWRLGRVEQGWRDPLLRVLAAMGLWSLWFGLQLIPLPRGFVTAVHPVWRSIMEDMTAAGIEPPERLTLALSPVLGAQAWHRLLAATAFLAGLRILVTRRSCSIRLAVAVSVVCSVEGLLGLLNFTLGGSQRGAGAIFNPSHHATAILMGMPLFFVGLRTWALLSPRSRSHAGGGSNPLIVLWGVGLLALLAWLASLSRGSLLFGGSAFLIWLSWEVLARWREEGEEVPRKRARVTPGGIALALGAVLFLVLLAEGAGIREGFAKRGATSGELSGAGRVELWRASLEGLAETPWIGLGPRGVENAMTRFGRMPMTTTPIWSHSDYVQVVAESGVPIALATLALLAGALVAAGRLIRDRRKSSLERRAIPRAALAGVSIALAHALTDFHLRIPLVGFTFMILLGLAFGEGAMLILYRGGRR